MLSFFIIHLLLQSLWLLNTSAELFFAQGKFILKLFFYIIAWSFQVFDQNVQSFIISYKLQPLEVCLLMPLLVLEDARTKLLLSFTGLGFGCHTMTAYLLVKPFDRGTLFLMLLLVASDLLVLVLDFIF